ncbi:MAG: hypothetical protein ACXWKX_05065 [Caulobacteraceae bacterium]
MSSPIRILLQTTIVATDDDWNIGRFSRLAAHLDAQPDIAVTARDRGAPAGADDPVLTSLDTSDFDELWLFAVDVGGGLTPAECAAIGRFRKRGGGILATRDHMDLGSSLCSLAGIGAAHFFHTRNPDPDESRRRRDDEETRDIDWPNYHSGANGDFQTLAHAGQRHPVLEGVSRLPAHPHEGAIGAPANDPSARVIATGVSRTTGRTFNLAVAFEGAVDRGRAIAQSTFHHFADYNLDPAMGCPSFVTEAPGDGFSRDPSALAETFRYFENLARWLAPRSRDEAVSV